MLAELASSKKEIKLLQSDAARRPGSKNRTLVRCVHLSLVTNLFGICFGFVQHIILGGICDRPDDIGETHANE